MEGQPLIEFKKVRKARTAIERSVLIQLSGTSLKGDFLSDPMTLDGARIFCEGVVSELQAKTDWSTSRSNELRVITDDSYSSVYVVRIGTGTGKQERLFGYEKITGEPAELPVQVPHYSDPELKEFKVIIATKKAAAEQELKYLQSVVTQKSKGIKVEGFLDTEHEQLKKMVERQSQYIQALDDALGRIKNKTFGICRATGKLIDKARLRAVPHARLSMEAKKAQFVDASDYITEPAAKQSESYRKDPDHPQSDANVHKLIETLKGPVQKNKQQSSSNTKPVTMNELNFIPLSNITMIQNYRDVEPPSEKDADVKELAESISKHGVMQAVLLRPNKKPGHYELIFGHRRYMACKVAGLDKIPASIKEVADDDILELQVTENLQRKDVHPMDEAVAFKSLMEKKNYTHDEISSRFGKSKDYIIKRIKLVDLIVPAQKLFKQNKMMLGHALEISRLQEADQAEVMKNFRGDFIGSTVNEVWEYICDFVMQNLDKAPWKKDDTELVPAAGSCDACPKRSGNQNLLFTDIKEKNRCFDRVCFMNKHARFLVVKARELMETKPDVPLVCDDLIQECSGFAVHDKFKGKIKGLPAEISYNKKGYNEDYFRELSKITDDQLAGVIRTIAFDQWLNKNFSNDVTTSDTGMRLIAEYAGIDLKAIEAEQKVIADKRNERIKQRIADLQKKKKELKPSAKSKSKK